MAEHLFHCGGPAGGCAGTIQPKRLAEIPQSCVWIIGRAAEE